jgi:hypothetical protein
MSELPEIRKAIEELGSDERAELKEWLDSHDLTRDREPAKVTQPAVAERPHRITIFLAVFALVVSILSFFASGWSLGLSIETTKITEEKAAPLVYDTEAKLRKPLTAKEPVLVWVQLKNHGERPAYHIKNRYTLMILQKDQKPERNYESSEFDYYEEPLLAHQDWTWVNYSPDEPQPLSPEQRSGIIAGDLKLWFFGKTVYEDSSGQMQKPLEWCWLYNPKVDEFWRCEKK